MRRSVVVRAAAQSSDEIEMLQKMLELAKARQEAETAAPSSSNGDGYDGPAFTIKTFNAISPVGLKKFETGKYKASHLAHPEESLYAATQCLMIPCLTSTVCFTLVFSAPV